MNGLDLFSGIGGISLALAPWVRPIAYCERDPYAQSVLLSRMGAGALPAAPIWDDVTTLTRDQLSGCRIDIIYGGFPCQDISIAGRGAGLAGERSGLFVHIPRLAKEVSPTFVFLENVAAIRTRGLSVVCDELARLGFDLRWTTVSAAEVGAPHLRRRWFCLAAHPERLKLWEQQGGSSGSKGEKSAFSRNDGSKRPVANANDLRKPQHSKGRNFSWLWPFGGGKALANSECNGLQWAYHSIRGKRETSVRRRPSYESWWATEPDVGRVAHGIPQRVDRIRGLGNAVVPLQARYAFQKLSGLIGG